MSMNTIILNVHNSFLNKYCITQTDITQKENQEPTIFCNAFSIDQYNKVQNIVKWILKSQYGIAEQLFSLDVILGITTPKEAHYFGEAVPKRRSELECHQHIMITLLK